MVKFYLKTKRIRFLHNSTMIMNEKEISKTKFKNFCVDNWFARRRITSIKSKRFPIPHVKRVKDFKKKNRLLRKGLRSKSLEMPLEVTNALG